MSGAEEEDEGCTRKKDMDREGGTRGRKASRRAGSTALSATAEHRSGLAPGKRPHTRDWAFYAVNPLRVVVIDNKISWRRANFAC